jgi:hypothetical protein
MVRLSPAGMKEFLFFAVMIVLLWRWASLLSGARQIAAHGRKRRITLRRLFEGPCTMHCVIVAMDKAATRFLPSFIRHYTRKPCARHACCALYAGRKRIYGLQSGRWKITRFPILLRLKDPHNLSLCVFLGGPEVK